MDPMSLAIGGALAWLYLKNKRNEERHDETDKWCQHTTQVVTQHGLVLNNITKPTGVPN